MILQVEDEKTKDSTILNETEFKYIQYLPANLGAAHLTLDTAIKNLYTPTYLNVS